MANTPNSLAIDRSDSIPNFDLTGTDPARLETMAEAGTRILESYRVLRKGGLNIVGEVLRDQGTFYEFEHYPKDDVFDDETHCQYYYHAHRPEAGEHGAFPSVHPATGHARRHRPGRLRGRREMACRRSGAHPPRCRVHGRLRLPLGAVRHQSLGDGRSLVPCRGYHRHAGPLLHRPRTTPFRPGR